MRVAHIITRMIVGGAQENTLLTCLDLKQMYGDDVLLITGPTKGPEGRLLEQGRAGDLSVAVVESLQRSINPVQDWRAYQQIRAILRDYKPDVVHTHSAKGGILGRAAAWKERVPAILHTVHGAPFYEYQSLAARKFYQSCERWAARRCHRFICVADAMTDLMVNAGVALRDRFTTIYSGMDVQPFVNAGQYRSAMRMQIGFSDDDIVVGKIARLFELKGHEFIVQAAPKVVEQCPKVKFLFVGDGALRGALETEIAHNGLQDHFVFVGLVPPQEVPKYIGAMDMLVHTSLREGLARALPQGLLAGIPAISYDIDGAREVVRTGETGYLLPPKSIEPLADAIAKLANDPVGRAAMGRNGRTFCESRFDHHHMTEQIRSLYAQTLQENGCAAN